MSAPTYLGAVVSKSSDDRRLDGEPDLEVLLLAHAGDEAACRVLIRRHGSRLYRILEKAHGDLQASEDILQETFLRAMESATQLRASESMFPWLTRIAFRLALDLRRRRWREELWPTGSEPDELPATSTPESENSERQLREAVDRALGRLKPYQREVLTLLYHSNFTVREIASVYGKTEVAIRKDLQRARDRLRRHLGRWAEEDR
ncbi:MAG: sigma-70 family RNA polymerase sigma factor [Myxococcales bacterium]|nr:sigma-70 family RNA polymerase sigma factor [Myxococcales bacterium]